MGEMVVFKGIVCWWSSRFGPFFDSVTVPGFGGFVKFPRLPDRVMPRLAVQGDVDGRVRSEMSQVPSDTDDSPFGVGTVSCGRPFRLRYGRMI